MMRRLLGTSVIALVAAMLLSACGPTFSSLPLPGSSEGGQTITVKGTFGEALNLSSGAAVRVNGVALGKVTSIKAHNFHAVVTMAVQKSAKVRQGASMRLRYTTPLGELFVDLRNPASGPLLKSGDSLSDTTTAPTVEDALASASLLINGGGLSQLQTITTEANKALDGNAGNIHDLIGRANTLMTQLNGSRSQIDQTLHALNAVAITLHQRRQIIHQALTDITPAAKALRANLGNLTALLTSLQRFAGTANGVVNATHDQVIKLVRQAAPILQELANDRGVLPATLRAVVALAHTADNLIPNDYLNLGAHLDLLKLLGALGAKGASGAAATTAAKNGNLLSGLAGLNNLGSTVQQGVSKELLSGLTNGLTGSKAGAKKSGSAGSSSPSGSGGLLGGLLGGGK